MFLNTLLNKYSSYIFTYLSTAVLMLSSLFVMLIINAIAGVETYGILIILLSTVGMLINILTFRSGEVVTRFLLDKKPTLQFHIVTIGLLFDCAVSILIILLSIGFSSIISNVFFENKPLLFEQVFITLNLVCNLLSGAVAGQYTSLKRFGILSFFRIIEPILKVVLLAGAALLIELDIKVICFIFFISSLVKMLIMWGSYFIEGFRLTTLQKQYKLLKEYFAFSLNTFGSSLLKAFGESSENLILGSFLGAQFIGGLQSIKIVIQPIRFFLNPIASIKYPSYITYFKDGLGNKVKSEVIKFSMFFSCASLVYFCIFYIFQQYIYDTLSLGDNFRSPNIIIYLLISTLTFCIVDWWFRSIALATNPTFSLWSNLLSIFLMWTVGIFLLSKMSFIGYIYFYVTLAIIKFILHYFLLIKSTKYKKTEII